MNAQCARFYVVFLLARHRFRDSQVITVRTKWFMTSGVSTNRISVLIQNLHFMHKIFTRCDITDNNVNKKCFSTKQLWPLYTNGNWLHSLELETRDFCLKTHLDLTKYANFRFYWNTILLNINKCDVNRWIWSFLIWFYLLKDNCLHNLGIYSLKTC